MLAKGAPELISIVLPVYNVEAYLAACLDSLLAQDDRDFELIAVDDASSDDSVAIIETYSRRFDGRLRIVRENDRKIAGARNIGMRLATGRFISFVDSDDIVEPFYVSALRQHQTDGDHDVVSGDMAMIDASGSLLDRRLPYCPSFDPPLTTYERVLGVFASSVPWGRLYRRELLIDFIEHIPHSDLFFTYKVLRQARSVDQFELPIYRWRQREDSLSKSLSTAHIGVIPRLLRDTRSYLASVGASERERAIAARRTLVFIKWMRGKIRRANNHCLTDFAETLCEVEGDVHEEVARVRAHGFGTPQFAAEIEAILVESKDLTRSSQL